MIVWVMSGIAGFVFLAFSALLKTRLQKGLSMAGFDQQKIARRAARLTFLRRAIAVAAILGLIVFGFSVSRDQRMLATAVQTCKPSGLFVLDLSGSIGGSAYRIVGKTLEKMTQENGRSRRFGLVFFSDDGYQLFDSCVKPQEFVRVIEMFMDQEAPNPWTTTFIGGTEISTGLRVALEMYKRDGYVKGAPVVLVSDLGNGEDTGVLEGALDQYRKNKIPFRIVKTTVVSGNQYGYPVPSYYDGVYRKHLKDVAFRVKASDFPPAVVASLKVEEGAPFPTKFILIAVIVMLAAALSEAATQMRRRSDRNSKRRWPL